MREAPGWYVDPNDDKQELYWNGSMWQQGGRLRRGSTPFFESAVEPLDGVDRDSTEYTNQLLEAVVRETRRSANYLAILTYITVTLLVLGAVGLVIGLVAAQS